MSAAADKAASSDNLIYGAGHMPQIVGFRSFDAADATAWFRDR
jgi:hypothetical protein